MQPYISLLTQYLSICNDADLPFICAFLAGVVVDGCIRETGSQPQQHCYTALNVPGQLCLPRCVSLSHWTAQIKLKRLRRHKLKAPILLDQNTRRLN